MNRQRLIAGERGTSVPRFLKRAVFKSCTSILKQAPTMVFAAPTVPTYMQMALLALTWSTVYHIKHG